MQNAGPLNWSMQQPGAFGSKISQDSNNLLNLNSTIFKKSTSKFNPSTGFKTLDTSVQAPPSLDLNKALTTNTADITKTATSGLDVSSLLGGASGLSVASSISGGVFDAASSLLGKEKDAGDGVVNSIAGVASMFGPWGQGVGIGLQALNFADKAFGKTTKNFNGNTGISGYQDFSTKGKQYRLTQTGSRKKAVAQTNANKEKFATAKSNINASQEQQNAATQAIGNTGLNTQKNLSGGVNYSVLTAKNGASLENIRNYIKNRNIKKEVPENLNLTDNLEKSEIQKFQNGGNLIPSGALHKNKHNLESVNSDLDGEITKKGIPVISYAEEGDILEYENDGKTPKVLAEGGEVIQHAEIEVGEIILNISLTKKLVELMKKDTPEAMIEAGKILARELMENTTDNTGLIEKTIGNED